MLLKLILTEKRNSKHKKLNQELKNQKKPSYHLRPSLVITNKLPKLKNLQERLNMKDLLKLLMISPNQLETLMKLLKLLKKLLMVHLFKSMLTKRKKSKLVLKRLRLTLKSMDINSHHLLEPLPNFHKISKKPKFSNKLLTS